MDDRVYKVIVVGVGKRGKHHLAAFLKNPRFEVAGICDVDRGTLERAAAEFGVSLTSTDVAALSREVRPDIFCFCTPPTVRLGMIRIGIASGAKLIAYEKPMALSMNEAIEIRQAVNTAGIKTVVSHQHRYGEHYRRVKEIIQSGAIGRVHTVYAHATGWMLHMATHLVDVMRWYNGDTEAVWVMGQAAGRAKLSDLHSSPDYIAGIIQFENGVRGYLESGAGAPDVPEVDYWWRKCRVGAQGTEGFAEVLTGGGWRAVTGNSQGLIRGGGSMNYELDTAAYVQDIAEWLDDDSKVHPCNGESAYRGFEVLVGVIRSAVWGGQVKLPLGPGEPELEALKRALPEDRPVLVSGDFNSREYLGPQVVHDEP